MDQDCLRAIKEELPDDPEELSKLVEVVKAIHIILTHACKCYTVVFAVI